MTITPEAEQHTDEHGFVEGQRFIQYGPSFEELRERFIAAENLRALAALIERPPLDDVLLKQDVALRIAGSITTVLAYTEHTAYIAEIERLRGLLIDPGSPPWENARAVLVADLRKDGFHVEADLVAEARPAEIQSHIALNLIAQAAARPDAGDEVGWIVRSGDGKRFRTWKDGWSAWTDDRSEATRYARRVDAEAVHSEDEDAWSIVPFAAMREDVTLEEAAMANMAVEQCLNPDGSNKYDSAQGYACAVAAIRLVRGASPAAGDEVGRVARALYRAQEIIADCPQNVAHVEYWFDEASCAADGEVCVREEYERMARAAIAAIRETVDADMVKRTEVQAVWRCAIGDMVGAMDILKKQWLQSKRKSDRQAGEVLSGVLDLVWAYRDPAPSSYEDANQNGKTLVDRVRAALSRKGGC